MERKNPPNSLQRIRMRVQLEEELTKYLARLNTKRISIKFTLDQALKEWVYAPIRPLPTYKASRGGKKKKRKKPPNGGGSSGRRGSVAGDSGSGLRGRRKSNAAPLVVGGVSKRSRSNSISPGPGALNRSSTVANLSPVGGRRKSSVNVLSLGGRRNSSVTKSPGGGRRNSSSTSALASPSNGIRPLKTPPLVPGSPNGTQKKTLTCSVTEKVLVSSTTSSSTDKNSRSHAALKRPVAFTTSVLTNVNDGGVTLPPIHSPRSQGSGSRPSSSRSQRKKG